MRRLAALLLLALPASAGAQQTSSSAGPERVSVTVYRAPSRAASERMDPNWLNGYALISETRQVTIPAGEGTIRFEGVAGGIIPESAIVSGLPDGVVEKNQDAYLLSPGSLLDRSLGRRVTIRRTMPGSGEAREEEAVIRTGAEGAVVLQTAAGFEALRCTGFNETIVYPGVPEGLSATPTLSVRTRSDRARSGTVTLSYLASGFDWQANYVAMLSPGGDRVDLFAWVTLASADETSFRNADTQAVAGRVNREDFGRNAKPRGEELTLRCWPSATTSDIEARDDEGGPPPPPPPPPPAPVAEQIVVTGSRVREASQEELGDLKLYRIPEPVTVAAKSQKQVAFLDKQAVRFRTIYRAEIHGEDPDGSPTEQLVRFENKKDDGLGEPLPGGRLVLFDKYRDRPILLGEGSMYDGAVGETIEVRLENSEQVRVSVRELDEKRGDQELMEAKVTNAGSTPASVEISLYLDDDERLVKTSRKLGRKNGRPLWEAVVPPGGMSVLRYWLAARKAERSKD